MPLILCSLPASPDHASLGMVRNLGPGSHHTPVACCCVRRGDPSGSGVADDGVDSSGWLRADDALSARWDCGSCSELSALPRCERKKARPNSDPGTSREPDSSDNNGMAR